MPLSPEQKIARLQAALQPFANAFVPDFDDEAFTPDEIAGTQVHLMLIGTYGDMGDLPLKAFAEANAAATECA